MRDVTTLQTKLLAYVEVLHFDPMSGLYREDSQYDIAVLTLQREQFITWLLTHVTPLTTLPYTYDDFEHLRSLGLLHFTMWEHTANENGFTPFVLNSTVLLFSGLQQDQRIAETLRRIHWTADPRSRLDGLPMIAASTLTPAGALIASKALHEISGLDIG